MDSTDEAQLKKATQWAKLDEKSRLRALSTMLSDPEGRAYVYDILDFCGVFRSAFSTDPLRMAFNCGTQSVGLWVMSDMESVNPGAYQKMINERNQRNADRSAVINAISDDSDESGGRSENNAVLDPFANLQDPVKYAD